MNKQQPSLAFCILMDVIGAATYALPFFGEFADIIWAPISAVIFFRTLIEIKIENRTFDPVF